MLTCTNNDLIKIALEVHLETKEEHLETKLRIILMGSFLLLVSLLRTSMDLVVLEVGPY